MRLESQFQISNTAAQLRSINYRQLTLIGSCSRVYPPYPGNVVSRWIKFFYTEFSEIGGTGHTHTVYLSWMYCTGKLIHFHCRTSECTSSYSMSRAAIQLLLLLLRLVWRDRQLTFVLRADQMIAL